jgi:hypothetical protein
MPIEYLEKKLTAQGLAYMRSLIVHKGKTESISYEYMFSTNCLENQLEMVDLLRKKFGIEAVLRKHLRKQSQKTQYMISIKKQSHQILESVILPYMHEIFN